MTQHHLFSSSLKDFSPETAEGFSPLRSFGELQRAIEAHLGPGAADILARPEIRSEKSELAWLAPLPGEPVPFEALGPAEKNAALGRLCFEARRLFALGKALEFSQWQGERPMGLALKKIAWRLAAFAAGADGPVRIFVSGGSPAAAGWGAIPKTPPAPPGPERERHLNSILAAGALPPELSRAASPQRARAWPGPSPPPPPAAPREGGFLGGAARAAAAAIFTLLLCAALFWILFPALTGLNFQKLPAPRLDSAPERDRFGRLWGLRAEYWRAAAACPAQGEAQEADADPIPLDRPERGAAPEYAEETPDYISSGPPPPPSKLVVVADAEGCWVKETKYEPQYSKPYRRALCFDKNGKASTGSYSYNSRGRVAGKCETKGKIVMTGPNRFVTANRPPCPGWTMRELDCTLNRPGVLDCAYIFGPGKLGDHLEYVYQGKGGTPSGR
jgi:hypothetical protein